MLRVAQQNHLLSAKALLNRTGLSTQLREMTRSGPCCPSESQTVIGQDSPQQQTKAKNLKMTTKNQEISRDIKRYQEISRDIKRSKLFRDWCN